MTELNPRRLLPGETIERHADGSVWITTPPPAGGDYSQRRVDSKADAAKRGTPDEAWYEQYLRD